jgi:hypothetical protein
VSDCTRTDCTSGLPGVFYPMLNIPAVGHPAHEDKCLKVQIGTKVCGHCRRKLRVTDVLFEDLQETIRQLLDAMRRQPPDFTRAWLTWTTKAMPENRLPQA